MNRLKILVKRNLVEFIKDPISLIFNLGFPIVMLIAMQLVFTTIPVVPEMFLITAYAPGICMFGFTFVALYTALTISGDKSSSFMMRISVSPTKRWEYLLSFVLVDLIVMFFQTVIVYAISFIFGLPFELRTLISLIYLIFCMLLFSAIGVFVGVVVKSQTQAGPISSILISASCLLGGVWLPIDTMSQGFITFATCLPFYPALKISQQALAGNYGAIFPNVLIVLGYTALFFVLSIPIFKKRTVN